MEAINMSTVLIIGTIIFAMGFMAFLFILFMFYREREKNKEKWQSDIQKQLDEIKKEVKLTPRLEELLKGQMEGKTLSEVADQNFVSRATVKKQNELLNIALREKGFNKKFKVSVERG